MKKVAFILLSGLLLACSPGEKKEESSKQEDHSAHAAEGTEKPKSKSPKQMAMTSVGENHVHMEYNSPGVRGRQIFGGLVAYDEVWVTGAHRATTINFQQDVMIKETVIPAGKYGFFTIPGAESWTLILSKDWDMHLADDYNQANDVLRFDVTPETLEEQVESLTYTVDAMGEGAGMISMAWADVKISFKFLNQ
jgi:hypothetical protein